MASSRSRSSSRRSVSRTGIPPTTNGPPQQSRLVLVLVFFFFTSTTSTFLESSRFSSHHFTFLTRVERQPCQAAVREPTSIRVSDRLDSPLGISFESPSVRMDRDLGRSRRGHPDGVKLELDDLASLSRHSDLTARGRLARRTTQALWLDPPDFLLILLSSEYIYPSIDPSHSRTTHYVQLRHHPSTVPSPTSGKLVSSSKGPCAGKETLQMQADLAGFSQPSMILSLWVGVRLR